MKKRQDLWVGIGMLAVSLFYIASSFSIKVFQGVGATAINSGTIPRFWGGCTVLLSLLLIVRSLGKTPQDTAQPKQRLAHFKEWIYHNYAVLLTFALLVGYALLLHDVGFVLCTAAYLILQILLLTPKAERNLIFTIALALLFSLAVDYLFVEILYVPLPNGILGL